MSANGAAHGSMFESKRRQEALGRAVAYVILILGAIAILIPFIWMVSTSLKDKDQIFTRDLEWLPTMQVYVKAGPERYPVYTPMHAPKQGGPYFLLLKRLNAGRLVVASVPAGADGKPPKTLQSVPAQQKIVSEDTLQQYRHLGARWSNYRDALTPPNFFFLRYLRNTLLITFLALAGQVISCSLVAFGFARLRFPGRGFLFMLVLATMMLPGQVTMVPLFKLFVTLKWYDSFLPLVVPSFFATSGFFIFLLRQYFMMQVPIEMDEAARIDGASTWGIFWRVLLPQAKAAVATVAIFSFMGNWNDFLGPLIYLGSPNLRTLALGLYAFQGEHSVELNLLMAAATVVMVPLLALFAAAQRYFIQGVVISGVKG